MSKAGVYLHIPFCGKKCAYCDFYSLPAGQSRMEAYTEALLRDIARQPKIEADTLYLGGGTPTLLGEARLRRIMGAVRAQFSFAGEATIEANPETVNPKLLSALREMGFDRISFGVQSLNADELSALGRRHTPEQAERAVFAAHDAGFTNISVDVMLALPGQTAGTLGDTLSRLTVWPITHVSAYLLQLEPGTPLAAANPALPDEDETAELYLQTVKTLADAGFAQYEISNFARPGYACRHNLKYWLGEPYFGLGAAAHGCINGRRLAYPRDIERYLAGDAPEEIGAAGGFAEEVMLRLRLTEGIDLTRYDAVERIITGMQSCAKAGLVEIEGGRLRLTPRGFLVSNLLIGRVVELGGQEDELL